MLNDTPQIKEMSSERILETLYELKNEMLSRKPSRYFFALGHAIRIIEDKELLTLKGGES